MTTPNPTPSPRKPEPGEFGITASEYSLYLKAIREGRAHLLSTSLAKRVGFFEEAMSRWKAKYGVDARANTDSTVVILPSSRRQTESEERQSQAPREYPPKEVAKAEPGSTDLMAGRTMPPAPDTERSRVEAQRRVAKQRIAELAPHVAKNPKNTRLLSDIRRVQEELRSAEQKLAELGYGLPLPDPSLAYDVVGESIGALWMHVCQIVQDEVETAPEFDLIDRARWLFTEITGKPPSPVWPFARSGLHDERIINAANAVRQRYSQRKRRADDTPIGDEQVAVQTKPRAPSNEDREEQSLVHVQQRLQPEYWQGLTARDLELESGCVFAERGYEDVIVTWEGADDGVDLILKQGNNIFIAQCKGQAKPVSPRVIRELIGSKQLYNADEAILVSTSGFTSNARTMAENTGVFLLDLDDLIEVSRQAKARMDSGLPSGNLTIDEAPRCTEPGCLRLMVRARSAHAELWRCSKAGCSGRRWLKRRS